MEDCKAHLPELVQSRIDDLVNVQGVDGELAVHMKELEARMVALEALAREEAGEEARVLVEDMERLIDRIRRDYVAIAYRQGVVDGADFKKLVACPGVSLSL
ncbi:hypothetical protein [Desulfovibrio sp. DV]|uniref:hypothetical protein n=1 Tax=Desulfovibrio sp. DV TaxID=1844708 RepID=UPI00094BC023|nr:hypothetical protein [Desulfovibrio sp. DV]